MILYEAGLVSQGITPSGISDYKVATFSFGASPPVEFPTRDKWAGSDQLFDGIKKNYIYLITFLCRVHQFTKVEMFSVCSQNQSEDMLESFKDLEMDLFKKLDLNFRLLDMPPTELGASAYQKYDIETWMPGRKLWGEISSCSNCTDYQSKRLNIKYIANSGDVLYAHTVNGTASAIPRLLISLVESNQIDKNTVKLPNILLNYLRKSEVGKEKSIPEIKLVKHIKSNSKL
ncbi:serine--tRNA ligase, mitochondrial-like [Calliphora vicina]|uniref:serine--tRNA ligase, mitochondrial-like n=1 Tax=Calliphora vicina TaxID=7373 RepID=UPI00325A643D